MFVHALPCFGLGTCFWPCWQLATRNYLLAAAAACGHLRRPRRCKLFHIDALGQGAPASVAGTSPRGMGSVVRRKKQTRFEGASKYFLCYLN
jgi:hypothetical protein